MSAIGRYDIARVRKGDGWPPSLPEFVDACRPRSSGVRYLGVPMTAEQKAELALPKPPVDRAKVDGFIAKMRAKVGAVQ